MKNLSLLLIALCICLNLQAQETLATVTARGAVTINAISVGVLNAVPQGTPSGSSIKLSTPGGNIGMVINYGDGSGGILRRWDNYIDHTSQSYILCDRTVFGVPMYRFCIDTIGNIGINTLKPKEKLSVNGKIRAREVKVESANWPDYVFDNGYKLPSLSEIEKYIKANGHLEDMPTSAEVQQEGIAIGELNAKLLKKIEELTLHLINLEKNNKKQQLEIDALKLKK